MRKLRTTIVGFMVLVLLLGINGGQGIQRIYAYDDSGEATTGQSKIMISETLDVFSTTPGSTIHFKIPIKAIEGTSYMANPYISLELADLPFTQESKISLSRDGNTNDVTNISWNSTYLNFSLKVKDSAKEGLYKVDVNFSALDAINGSAYSTTLLTPIQIKVVGENSTPTLTITNLSFEEDVEVGDHFELYLTVKNDGQLTAKNTYLTMDGYSAEGILPDYTAGKKKLGDLSPGETKDIEVPVYVSSTATNGVKTLTLKSSFKDSEGNKYEEETTNIFIWVPVDEESITKNPVLIISDVKQTPQIPTASGKVSISFVVQNKGKKDMKEIRITPTNLTNTNFSPVNSKPYTLISNIKAGDKKKVTLKFTVSKTVEEGLNQIDLQFTYKDKNGKLYDPEVSKIFVLNVKNAAEAEVKGVPKLIISDFDAGKDDLKAGNDFTFAFDIYNTHSSLNANNIKVTISSEENAFSVTKGSNSFYISGIKPGETVHKEIGLKVKADCVTKAYPLKIDFEYEYEGMQKLENEISTGLKVSETLNLQVLENSRPTVNNIIIGTWEAPMANTPTNMGFDFYNMGKSILYNVTSRIEGTDFTPTQQTKFIGNVEPGTGDTYEMEITPNIEGDTGHGTLIITYEDSNGNSYEVPTEFEAFIDVAYVPSPEEMGELPMEETPVKKALLTTWVFILIQIAIFFISIFVVRKIIIHGYKRKLMKELEDEL